MYYKITQNMYDFKIDSFGFSFPLSIVSSYPSSFDDNLLLVSASTGEVLDKKGVTYAQSFADSEEIMYFKKRKYPNGEYYFQSVLNCKLRPSLYFYDSILLNLNHFFHTSDFVFNCDFQTFIKNSFFFDIDICFDFYADDDYYRQILLKFNKNFRSMNRFYKDSYFDTGDKSIFNVGWSISERKRTSLSNPFLKLYSKGSRGLGFNDYMLRNSISLPIKHNFNYCKLNLHNLRRCEFTIKNSKHLQQLLNKSDIAFIDIFSLTSSDFQQLFNIQFNGLNLNVKESKISSLSFNDELFLNLFLNYIKFSKEDITLLSNPDVLDSNLNFLLSDFFSYYDNNEKRFKKSRLKRKINAIFAKIL